MSRPEHLAPPEDFYNENEAVKYTKNSRIVKVQSEMTHRCLELIGIAFNREPDEDDTEDKEKNGEEEGEEEQGSEDNHMENNQESENEDCEMEEEKSENEYLKPLLGPSLNILDLGCGSALSGQIISEYGHIFWGIDISPAMLDVAHKRGIDGELMLGDLGHGFNFAPGFFDAAISVSALQWLCNSDKSQDIPWKRLLKFFTSLHKSLKLGGKAAIQFYPENEKQLELISNAAMKAGFAGGIYVDYPNSTTAKKYYLILSTLSEGKLGIVMKEGKNEVDDNCHKLNQKIKKRKGAKNGKFNFKSKYWVYNKKERQRKQGKLVRVDSKYTGRKRKRI